MSKRGGFPGGMGGFGGMNINNLMKQAKQMQADITKTQEDIAAKEFTKVLKEIKIKPEVVDPDDVEMLQDLILTCVNEALRQVEDASSAAMGKFNIPGF